MKKIDKLLIKSFIPPFIVTFFIALFVLIMQFLWTYIDEIIGKGASFFIIIELLSYLSISLIPTALPIAILISSVMVMGNLAEKYELASIKSAGVPLLRVMKPLMFLTFGISIFSFFCSNYIIPLANLQFKSRLYDIRKQKPALNLEAGVFNDDFKGFIIHIGKKDPNNRDIEDVIIYDHTANNNKQPMQILAKRGEMFNTVDGNYFIMKLYEGTQYQETKQTTKGNKKTYPFSRISFKEWNKVFDLSEFNIKETDKDLFDSHHTMLSVKKLRVKIDSLEERISKRFNKLGTNINQYISLFQSDTILIEAKNLPDGAQRHKDRMKDTLNNKINVKKETKKRPRAKTEKQINRPKAKKKDKHERASKGKNYGRKPMVQTINKPLSEYKSITEIFPKDKVQRNLYSKAQSYARNLQSQAKSTSRSIDKYKENLVKHIFEMNIKFSMALICFIFLFIGAPMGAIVRKGGFGYPILIAIVFFMIYIVLNIFCKKLAESFVLSAVLAAWIPCLILFPIGLVLTFKAMNDSKLLDVDKYFAFMQKVFSAMNK